MPCRDGAASFRRSLHGGRLVSGPEAAGGVLTRVAAEVGYAKIAELAKVQWNPVGSAPHRHLRCEGCRHW